MVLPSGSAWTFDAVKNAQIRQIVENALPIAALTPHRN
jgi:hypothetical protein